MISVVRAVAEDARTVADIYLASRAGAGTAIPPGVHPPDDVRRFVAEVVLVQRDTWLAWDDGRAVGVCVLSEGVISDEDPAPMTQLDWLWVLPDAQACGVGSLLLDHARRLAPEGLALWAFETNLPARHFYEDRGFVAVGATDGSGNEERAPDVRYLWRPGG